VRKGTNLDGGVQPHKCSSKNARRRSCARKEMTEEGDARGRRRRRSGRSGVLGAPFLFKIKPRTILSIHPNCWVHQQCCWVHQQCCWVHLATPIKSLTFRWFLRQWKKIKLNTPNKWMEYSFNKRTLVRAFLWRKKTLKNIHVAYFVRPFLINIK